MLHLLSAYNTLSNSYGFSPKHLHFEFNPLVPDVFQSILPCTGASFSESILVRDNLNAMSATRQFLGC